jgi:hypothetical protein
VIDELVPQQQQGRNPDIAWAIDEFIGSKRLQRYAIFRNYYLGDTGIAYATSKWKSTFGLYLAQFSDNLCEAVIDAFSDRLELTGFSSNKAESTQTHIAPAEQGPPAEPGAPADAPPAEDQPPLPAKGADAETDIPVKRAPSPGTKILVRMNDPLAEDAWNLWESNYGDIVSDEVHREVLITGDAFLIVWPDEDMETTLWPQYSHEMACRYHENKRGKLEIAAKWWKQADERVRLTLYYEDRVERYITRHKVKQLSKNSIKPASFVPYSDNEAASVVRHGYGQVPVFHFANKAYGEYGISILGNVVPLQDALNKSVCDMLVAMEFASFKQRWVTGIEVEIDETTGKPKQVPFDYGVDRLISAGDPEAKFGEFGQTDLNQFLAVQRDFRGEVARVVGIPLYYLYTGLDNAGHAPSGDSLKRMEIRFSRAIKKMQTRFGKSWEESMEFALDVDSGVPDDLDLNAVWMSESASYGTDLLNELVLKQSIGIPASQLQKEAGYDDDEIELFATQAAANAPAVPPPGPGDPNDPRQARSDPATAAKDKVVAPQNQPSPAPQG